MMIFFGFRSEREVGAYGSGLESMRRWFAVVTLVWHTQFCEIFYTRYSTTFFIRHMQALPRLPPVFLAWSVRVSGF